MAVFYEQDVIVREIARQILRQYNKITTSSKQIELQFKEHNYNFIDYVCDSSVTHGNLTKIDIDLNANNTLCINLSHPPQVNIFILSTNKNKRSRRKTLNLNDPQFFEKAAEAIWSMLKKRSYSKDKTSQFINK